MNSSLSLRLDFGQRLKKTPVIGKQKKQEESNYFS